MRLLRKNDGVSAIIIALLLMVFLGVAALALDISHLAVVDNELQNAADAGALAGARVLYNDEDGSINTGANGEAAAAATRNLSDKLAVEVGDGDVERGHWCFSCINPDTGRPGVFTPNPSTEASALWEGGWPTFEEIDADTSIVNAVRVKTHRSATPAKSLLAGVFGYSGFNKNSEAVAYVNSWPAFDVDKSLVVCQDSITNGCNIGRMLNSGGMPETSETAEWTNFSEGCVDPASTPSLQEVVCEGDPNSVGLFSYISTTNGVNASVFGPGMSDTPSDTTLRGCWLGAGLDDPADPDNLPDKPWKMELLVVDCTNSPVNCRQVVGGVKTNVVWITKAGGGSASGPSCDASYYPKKMYNPVRNHMWTCSNPSATDATCWNEFVAEFNLQNMDGSPAPCQKKAIYFMPECSSTTPGAGVAPSMPEIPVLVN
jgi:hypothetical protein